MNVYHRICDDCGGTGKTILWKVDSTDEKTGIGTAHREESVCESCNGEGWIEYAIFSVEEANAILKHCGLSTES